MLQAQVISPILQDSVFAMDYSALYQLTLSQLEILLGHLKIGPEHLKKYLTDSQLRSLLKTNKISKSRKSIIKSNILEQQGNIVLLVNTIFTSILGGALGFSTVGSFEIATFPVLLFISGLIAIISSFAGRTSYILTLQKVNEAIIQQKLALLQIKVLYTICKKLKSASEHRIDLLNQFAFPLQEENLSSFSLKSSYLLVQKFESKEGVYQWLESFKERMDEIKKSGLQEKRILKLDEIMGEVEKLIQNKVWLNNLLIFQQEKASKNTECKENKQGGNYDVLTLLTNPYVMPAKETIKHKTWWKEKHKDIVVGLFPTLLGGGASLFVFFTGIPDILKRFNLCFLYTCITSSLVKKIELYLFFSITLYFGFIYLYNQKKSFERKQKLDHSQQVVTHQEISYRNLKRRYDSLEKLSHQIERLHLILDA